MKCEYCSGIATKMIPGGIGGFLVGTTRVYSWIPVCPFCVYQAKRQHNNAPYASAAFESRPLDENARGIRPSAETEIA